MSFHEFGNRWFALQVKVRFEETCARILRTKGYEEFLPLTSFTVCGNVPKALKKALPLFPGYLFCKMNSNVNGPLVTTPGVMRIVSFGGVPCSINEKEITAIRCLMESGRPMYAWPHLHVGQRITITAGPFCGVQGNLLRIKGGNRLVVCISVLQRAAAVEIDSEWVASAETTSSCLPNRGTGLPLSSCQPAPAAE